MRLTRFESDEFQRGLEVVLDGAHRGAADAAEVRATAARIDDGDADSWVLEWIASAGAVRAAGNAALRAGDRSGALAGLRRAASYYGAALELLSRSSEEDRRPELWRRERDCWECPRRRSRRRPGTRRRRAHGRSSSARRRVPQAARRRSVTPVPMRADAACRKGHSK